jgi:predicted SAM-dependent methyltransferase
MQLEMIEQQRQHWLKHPDEFIKDVTRMMFTIKNEKGGEIWLK